jgi:HlyD family secretion protein
MAKTARLNLKTILILALLAQLTVAGGCKFGPKNQPITATGTIEMKEILIGTKTAGRVVKLRIQEGQTVKSGDLMAELDHEEIDAQLTAARANLEVMNANLDAAQTDLKRTQQLYQAQLISQAQYDQAVTRATVLEAQAKQAAANIALLKTQLKNVMIYAPGTGVVSEKLVEVGELVTPGSSLFTILDNTKPWVRIYLPLVNVEKVFLNQKAYLQMDAYPDRKFHGRVSFISQEAEFTPKDFQTKEERVKQVYAVKIELDNTSGLLKAGMPVDVALETKKN